MVERRFEAEEDLPADRLADGLCGIAVQDPDAPDRRAVGPSRTGLLAGSDPAAEGRMAMYIAIPPDADRGMPRWGVTPSHGLDGRIGLDRQLAVAQLPARQRHAGTGLMHTETRFSCTGTPMWDVHSWIGNGNAESRLRIIVFLPNIGGRGDRWPGRIATTADWRRRLVSATFRSRRSCSPSIERNRMMARTKRSRRSYGAGEWGRNRVRIFPDPKTGLFQIEWRENGRRLSQSLKHRDWARAKRQADQFAAGFIDAPNGNAEAKPEPLTLDRLFEIYGEEVTPAKGAHTRQHDRTSMRMFLRFFGRDRDPATLSQRDWDRFIRERRAGRIGPSGKPVSDRTVEYDLKFLIAVLNWASKSRDERGRLLLDRNPLRGLRTPSEKNPTRVVLAEEEYRALLKVSRRVDWRFRVALVLAHETGHRIGAIRQLRWDDIDFDGGAIVWRAEHDKSGYEHITPVTPEALDALKEAQRWNPSTGHAPILPAPRNPSACMGAALAQGWWDRAERLAGLEPKPGRGWHSLRRKFASDLMDQPLKVLCQLGGWKTAKTVLRCYQRADEGQLRKALEDRRRARG